MIQLLRGRTKAGLAPFSDVTLIESDANGSVYRAVGDDPRMVWTPSSDVGSALDGRSAVRVRVVMSAIEGRLRDPCVYFDWGDGFSEETRKPLSLISPGHYAAVGNSNAGACRAIRLDPSAGPCTFRVQSIDVESLGARSDHTRRLSVSRRLARRILRRLPAGLQAAAREGRRALFEGRSRSFPIFGRAIDPWRSQYAKAFDVARNLRSPHFAAPALEPPRRDPDDASVIAFYLPQFYPTPENDFWWGAGFTEWSNVSKATPQFVDHYQPRLPSDLGFYDLRVPEVRRRQAKLANNAGVDAFCFHYYWFNGRRVLDRPLDAFADDSEIDMPFALCWANENWTRRWDGLEDDVLLAQKHSPEDDRAVLVDLCRYIRNPRYLRIDGRPLIVIYRPDALPDAKATVARWREAARDLGVGELFLLCTDAFGHSDYEVDGFDGLVEFPPHGISIGEISRAVTFLNPRFAGRIYDYEAVVAAKEDDLAAAADSRRFPSVMPAWDNEARKPGAGHIFHRATPALFQRWTSAALDNMRRCAPPGARLVFVNAWNEWAEGAYLEPDRWFGHGFAQALRSALQERAPKTAMGHPAIAPSQTQAKRRDAVVLAHIFYSDLIEALADAIEPVSALLDAMVTFPDTWTWAEVERLRQALPGAWLEPLPNRGRDIEPFLHLLGLAKTRGYSVFCKIHSKKSPHLPDGDAARSQLVLGLLKGHAVVRSLALFADEPGLGLLALTSAERRIGDPDVMFHNRGNVDFLARRLGIVYGDTDVFAAGSMFWGRFSAFDRLASEKLVGLPFEIEMGRIDGTLAHAFERLMGAIVRSAGFRSEFLL